MPMVYYLRPISLTLLLIINMSIICFGQEKETSVSDTLSKLERTNKKLEGLFQIIPVPLYSYSVEAGHTFGLAKFNLIDLSRVDSVSQASRISEVATVSTKGRINISVSTDLNWHQDKYMVFGYFNYKRQPEYMVGIGNDFNREDLEKISFDRFKFVNYGLIQAVKHLYIGVGLDVSDYRDVETDSTSFLIRDNVTGLEGGTSVGIGFSVTYDSRDNRYNAYKGAFLTLKTMYFPSFFGNPYVFSTYNLDARKYFNLWHKHIIAIQATTSYRSGNVPFYELSMLGGEDQMRGYYKGVIRDKVLVDGQVEYRMPVWNIFGINAWVGTGRVASSYSSLMLDGFWLSYGGGFRIKVDSKHNTNLRFDFGFGPGGIKGYYINFGEAF